MADLTITATSVAKSTNAQVRTGIAGETITAGQPVYISGSTGKYLKAISSSVAAAAADGIALHAATLDQPLTVQWRGTIEIGATVNIGTIYLVSGTSGGIQPHGDLGAAEIVTVLGIGTTSSALSIQIHQSGVAKA